MAVSNVGYLTEVVTDGPEWEIPAWKGFLLPVPVWTVQ